MFSLDVGRIVLGFLNPNIVSIPEEVRDIDDEELQQMQYVFGGVMMDVQNCARLLMCAARKGALKSFMPIYSATEARYYQDAVIWVSLWSDIWFDIMVDAYKAGGMDIVDFLLDKPLDQPEGDLLRLIEFSCSNNWEDMVIHIFSVDVSYTYDRIGHALHHLINFKMFRAMRVVVAHRHNPLKLNDISFSQYHNRGCNSKSVVTQIINLKDELICLARQMKCEEMVRILQEVPVLDFADVKWPFALLSNPRR